MDELYLDNIDEFVNDQNKIVTYKWLSLTLGVHVNTAKQMLFHYLDQKRKEGLGTPLHATYLVSGRCVKNGSACHKVSVVREDKLEAAKAMVDMTVSVHVYSVQRAELKDSSPLYSTDYEAVKENLKDCNKYSAIRCSAAVPMSSAELEKSWESTASNLPEKELTKPTLNPSTSSAPKHAAKQPAGIMGMFASKTTAKSQESTKDVKTEQNRNSSEIEASKAKPASSNFFGKTSQKKSDDKTNTSIKDEKDSSISSSMEKSLQTSKKSGVDTEERPEKSLKGQSKDTNKTKRPEVLESDDEKIESQQKKRRRIKKPQPDSSDEEMVPDSPPTCDVQIPSPKSQKKQESVSRHDEVKRRKRRRVLKSKTFIDEDGSFVTEKGYVSESYSESEEEPEPKIEAKHSSSLKPSGGKKVEEKKSLKKISAANKTTKQSSIVGFFQKK